MKCNNCGKENIRTNLNCDSCGYLLKDEPSQGIYAEKVVYAGFLRRFLAFCVDTIIISFSLFLLGLIISFIIGPFVFLVEIFYDFNAQREISEILWMDFLIIFITSWIYYTLFESSERMATPGKIMTESVVVGKDKKKISFARANARFFLKCLNVLFVPLFIGFFVAGFTKNKQALHDFPVRTYVVRK